MRPSAPRPRCSRRSSRAARRALSARRSGCYTTASPNRSRRRWSSRRRRSPSARTTQGLLEGGARWNLRPGLDTGVQLAYEQGPRDDDPDASLGVHLEADRMIGPAPVNALLRLRQHLDTDRGTQLDARATVGVYGGHGAALGLFVQGTWASEKSFEAYYGVRDSGLLFVA